MNEHLSAADDAQLARWAYGRVETPLEAERAHLAALELQRRAADAWARAANIPKPDVSSAGLSSAARVPDDSPHPAASTITATAPAVDIDPAGDEPRRPLSRRSRRAVVGVAALALLSGTLVLGVVVGQSLLEPPPAPPSSLDVFDRTATQEELALVGQFERQGERVSIGPRILDSIGYGSIVAFRAIVSSSGVVEPELDLVCVAAVEFNPRAQTTMISDPVCVARSAFETRGLEATLFGLGGQYDVVWGPVGRAKLDVTITEAERAFMEPGFEAAFFEKEETDLDRQYLAERALNDQTGLAISRVRTLFPIELMLAEPFEGVGGEAAPEAEWVAIYTGTPFDSGDELACIAVLAEGLQREHECRAVDEFGVRGLRFEVERGDATFIVTWSERGEVSTMVVRGE